MNVTVVPEILSRVLHKDSQGGDAKILGLWVGNQSCKKDSHPPQPLQKHSRCCRILSSPPFLLKKHSRMSHNHPLTTLFKMTCAKQIPTCCKTILIQALLSDWLLTPFFVCHCKKYNWHCQTMGKKRKRNASTMKKWCLESESCLASCHLFCACQVWPCSSNVFSIEHTVIHLTENVTNKVTNAWWQGFVKRFCEDCFYAVLNELLCSNNLIDHSFPNPEHELYQIHFRGIWCTKYENMAWCTQQLLQTIFVVDWGIAKVKDRLFCMLFLVAPLKSFFDECFKHTCRTIPLTTCAHRFLSDVIAEITLNRVFWS